MASDELKIDPKEAVYIGDIYSIDIIGANRAGFQSILLDPIGAWNEVDCQKVKNLEEIHKWVLNGNLGLLSTK